MVVPSSSVVTVGHNTEELKTFPYFNIACAAFPHCTGMSETITWALSLGDGVQDSFWNEMYVVFHSFINSY